MQDKYQTTQYNIKLCGKIIKTMQNTPKKIEDEYQKQVLNYQIIIKMKHKILLQNDQIKKKCKFWNVTWISNNTQFTKNIFHETNFD